MLSMEDFSDHIDGLSSYLSLALQLNFFFLNHFPCASHFSKRETIQFSSEI